MSGWGRCLRPRSQQALHSGNSAAPPPGTMNFFQFLFSRLHADTMDMTCKMPLRVLPVVLLLLAACLSGCMQESPVDTLVADLYADNAPVQHDAAERLAEMGEPAVSPLIGVFSSGEPSASQWAAAALCQIGGPAIDPLIRSLSTEDDAAREWGVLTLACIGGPAVDPLVAQLKTGNERRHAAVKTALIRIGEPALPALVVLQNTADAQLAGDAAEIIQSIYLTAQFTAERANATTASGP